MENDGPVRGSVRILTAGDVVATDREAFAELVDRHGAAVAALLRRLCRNCHDADDLFQEVSVRVWRHIDDRPRLRNERSWLMAIAWRAFLDHAEKAKRRTASAANPEPATPDVEDPARRAEHAERCRLLHGATEELAPPLREVISLHYTGSLSLREVANLTGLSIGTVKSRLAAGLEQLRRRLP